MCSTDVEQVGGRPSTPQESEFPPMGKWMMRARKPKHRLILTVAVTAAIVVAGLQGLATASAQNTEPSGRAWHSLVADGIGFAWLFGGATANGRSDELWSLDVSMQTWSAVSPKSKKNPGPRHGHASAYDTDQDLHIIFGGASPVARKSAFLADTWFYSPVSNRWNSSVGCPTDGGGGGPGKKGGGGKGSGGKASGPAERMLAAMAYNPTTREVTLFGGDDPDQNILFGDTWTLQVIDGESCWTNEGALDPTPSPRTMAAMTWVWSRGTVVLHGGRDSRNLCDLWEWDGDAWSLINASDGPCLRDHSLAFDDSGRLIAFGGQLNPKDASEPNLSTFFYDFTTDAWTESPRLSPVEPPRAGAPAVRDVGTDSLILFGGTAGVFFFDDTLIIPISDLTN